jgi:hypothetical protein
MDEGWKYRQDIGVWVDADDMETAMMTGHQIPMPAQGAKRPQQPERRPRPRKTPDPGKRKPRPMTKKCDIETGEDMKGE